MTRWVFVTFLCFFALITRGHFESTDEIAVFQQTRSLWEHHDLDVSPMINTRIGHEGRRYAIYNIGQSIAALPLYAAGKLLRRVLSPQSAAMLAGPVIGDPPTLWGGEVEIFAVDLFNAFMTALLCALFFRFSLRLGASSRSALIATALLGVSTHIAGFSAGFFQHSLEALLILFTFYLLFLDVEKPRADRLLLAGLSAGFAVLVRLHTAVLLPAFALYLWWSIRRRRGSLVTESLPFFAPVLLGIFGHIAVNGYKFGSYSLAGGYADQQFDAPLLEALYGFLFSPGDSLFLFTPLLFLLPLYAPPFARERRAETICVAGITLSYMFFYANYNVWHGQWCFGPRYLAPTLPLLFLPLARWWDTAPVRWRRVALGLAALGAFVEVLHVAVNFSYVFHAEKYESFNPPFGYLFIPRVSQIATHTRALFAHDGRVDMWLINVYRNFGWGAALLLFLPLAAGCALGVWQLRLQLRRP
jgi:hypothetical protein